MSFCVFGCFRDRSVFAVKSMCFCMFLNVFEAGAFEKHVFLRVFEAPRSIGRVERGSRSEAHEPNIEYIFT